MPYGHCSGATNAASACDCTGQGMNLPLTLTSPRLENLWQWGELSESPHAGQKNLQTLSGSISLRHLVPVTAGSSQGACSELLDVQRSASQPKDAAAACIGCAAPIPVSMSLLSTCPSSLSSVGMLVFSLSSHVAAEHRLALLWFTGLMGLIAMLKTQRLPFSRHS